MFALFLKIYIVTANVMDFRNSLAFLILNCNNTLVSSRQLPVPYYVCFNDFNYVNFHLFCYWVCQIHQMISHNDSRNLDVSLHLLQTMATIVSYNTHSTYCPCSAKWSQKVKWMDLLIGLYYSSVNILIEVCVNK